MTIVLWIVPILLLQLRSKLLSVTSGSSIDASTITEAEEVQPLLAVATKVYIPATLASWLGIVVPGPEGVCHCVNTALVALPVRVMLLPAQVNISVTGFIETSGGTVSIVIV